MTAAEHRRLVQASTEAQRKVKEETAALDAFKNFHRSLCDRFGYTHDEKDWRRDQASLIEHIAKLVAPKNQQPDAEKEPT